MRVGGVVRDARVGLLAEPGVLVAERLQPLPQFSFEGFLAVGRALLEQHRERDEQLRVAAIAAGEIEQGGENAQIVPCRAEIARDDDPQAAAVGRSLGPDTGEVVVPVEIMESLVCGCARSSVLTWRDNEGRKQ